MTTNADLQRHSLGDAVQTRMIAEQVAEAVILKYEQDHPRPVEAAVPPLIKWMVGAAAALGLAAVVGGGTWLVSSMSQVQITLARMDERMTTGSVKDSRFDEHERRIVKLESYHSQGGR